MNATINQLTENTQPAPNDNIPIMSGNGSTTKRISFATMAEQLWEQMYVHAKAVIVSCKYCLVHNAVSNPTCCRCGAPMGEAVK